MLRILLADGSTYCVRPEICGVFVGRDGAPLCGEQVLNWVVGVHGVDLAMLEAAGCA